VHFPSDVFAGRVLTAEFLRSEKFQADLAAELVAGRVMTHLATAHNRGKIAAMAE
jgi:hypothetical protein